jgi:rhombotail lipoprotein
MKTNLIQSGLLLAAAFSVAGCGSMAGMNRSAHYSSDSLYPFLGAELSKPVGVQTAPQPSLPMRVGIAFVPGRGQSQWHGKASPDEELLSACDKLSLLQPIANQFEESPLVRSVEMIPSSYLSSAGGPESLDRIQSIFDVNTLVLISYDQVQYSDEGSVALSYWTFVGAYFVPGEKNVTKTMVDVAVYDIASRRQIFHVMGNSETPGFATPVNLSEELRDDCKTGFEKAIQSLTGKLRVRIEKLNPTGARKENI